MFTSFFPKPKFFFLSFAILGLVAVLIWFFYADNLASAIGLPFAPEGEAAPIGFQFFIRNEFLFFYIYFGVFTALFYGFWHFYAPHQWDRWSILGSALIIFLSYISVQASVALNVWYGGFYNFLQQVLSKEITAEVSDVYTYAFQFTEIAAVNICIVVISIFFTRHYIFRWRMAMNDFYVSYWPKLRHVEGASQRVQEDTMRFAILAQPLADSFLDAVMTLLAFLPLLAGLSVHVQTIPIFGEVTNALMWAAILWPMLGTALVILAGIKLPGLEFNNQKVEAAYRKELVLGEDDEQRMSPPTAKELFENVRKNYFRLYFHYLYFDVTRYLYLQADVIFLLLLLSPSIAAATITFGIFQQINQAFDKVSSSFLYLFRAWPSMIELLSVYKRLRAFEAIIYDEKNEGTDPSLTGA